jgi:hypothetical protein
MRALAIIAALLVGACGDNTKPARQDAGPGGDAAVPLAPCLERPTDLARPPTGQLPCELLPPGFVAEQP